MAFRVKVEYGGKRFATFLLENVSYDVLVSNSIRLRYQYGECLSSRLFFFVFFFFAFSPERLRTAKEVKDRDYKKIIIQANEIDSPCPRKMRRLPLWRPAKNFVVWNPNNCRTMHQLFRQQVSLKRRQRVPHQLEMTSKDVAL